MKIETVSGPIQPEALGVTLMHEHTFCDLWEWGGRRDYDSIIDDETLLSEELTCYRAAGGSAIVDVTPAEERVFRAAARAQRAVGVSITTHTTHFGDLALEQVDLLLDEGVTPERIIIGHLGERRDARDVLEVARTGVFVQIDHVGRSASAGTQPERQRASADNPRGKPAPSARALTGGTVRW